MNNSRNQTLSETALALPAGRWVERKGVRYFVANDPDWVPTELAFEPASIFKFAPLPRPRPIAPYRHICDCGCLLFGVENCPQCQWLNISRKVAA